MRVLLDECVPSRLRREFAGHDVRTVADMGWSGTKNGELLRRAAADGFQALVTADQGVAGQQRTIAGLGLVVLVATSNRLADLLPLMPSVLRALATLKPGDVAEIDA